MNRADEVLQACVGVVYGVERRVCPPMCNSPTWCVLFTQSGCFQAVAQFGRKWPMVSGHVGSRTPQQCREHYLVVRKPGEVAGVSGLEHTKNEHTETRVRVAQTGLSAWIHGHDLGAHIRMNTHTHARARTHTHTHTHIGMRVQLYTQRQAHTSCGPTAN